MQLRIAHQLHPADKSTALAPPVPAAAWRSAESRGLTADVLTPQRTLRNHLPGAWFGGLVLQRKCACGGTCVQCQEERRLQRKAQAEATTPDATRAVPPTVYEVLRSPGQPLSPGVRDFMEARFGHDFRDVRVHTDTQAAVSARAVQALAYTVGSDVVFDSGRYSPGTMEGRKLLAHELTHMLQQAGAPFRNTDAISRTGDLHEREANHAAETIFSDIRMAAPRFPTPSPPLLQRQAHGTPSPISVRSPVFEELVTEVSTAAAEIQGRPLSIDETELAQSIFGNSLDYSRVRLIPTRVLQFRTVANTIRVPQNFTIADEFMAETLIHELTHVWQYQHGGTSYISVSLATQIAGTLSTGGRNAAYCYKPAPGKSFFEYMPEQQAMIVENYFGMIRDQTSEAKQRFFKSNYDWVCSGKTVFLSWADRQAEIARELPLHEPLIQQMRAALPRLERDILTQRAEEVMQTPLGGMPLGEEQRELAPVKPLLELRFGGKRW